MSISIFGQRMIIVNSAEVATELLEKKGSIYSDRPVMEMGGEMVGWKNTLVLVPYGDRFRSYRKLFHKLIGNPASMSQFHPTEEVETRKFLKHLLSTPQDLAKHVRKYVMFFLDETHHFDRPKGPPAPSSSAFPMAMKSNR